MNVLFIHTLVLALASHRIAAAGGAHPIAGIVVGRELEDSATTGTAGQAGRPIGRSNKMPAPENR
jgi:hypothetical protein